MSGVWRRQGTGETVVVFIHGILSDGDLCWRSSSGAYWPDLVASEPELESVGVYVFTYHSTLTSGSYSIGDAVDALWEYLRLDDVLRNKRLIFACHSMGGIIARRLIVSRSAELVQQSKIVGVFLIASPSLGSRYANLLSDVIKFMGHRQADALKFEQSNSWLNDLDREFLDLKDSRRLHLRGKELVEDKFIVAPLLFRDAVVQTHTGIRYFDNPVKIPDSDHFTIARPASKSAFQHRLLKAFVLEMLRE